MPAGNPDAFLPRTLLKAEVETPKARHRGSHLSSGRSRTCAQKPSRALKYRHAATSGLFPCRRQVPRRRKLGCVQDSASPVIHRHGRGRHSCWRCNGRQHCSTRGAEDRPHPRWPSTWHTRSCQSLRQVRVSVSILWGVAAGTKTAAKGRKREVHAVSTKVLSVIRPAGNIGKGINSSPLRMCGLLCGSGLSGSCFC
ncbi:small ribosomal subunit protein eS12 isoform X1 [Rattus norvegicus]|uniref:small ribosomal subunit protein eS12 isoform X1 n=1 Tax=Rattus norvegicus TaxID=10116 RepID=UPI002FD803D5